MNKDIKYLEHDEVSALLASITNPRDHLMFLLMYAYGLRVSELTDLTVSDIDLQGNAIYIIAKKRKDKIRRRFQLSERIKSHLVDWMEHRDKSSQYLFYGRRYVGGGVEITKMSRENINILFLKYCLKVGIPRDLAHPHTLRHSIAVSMATKGMGVDEVKEMLRHSNIQSTYVYFNITNERRDEIVNSTHNKLGL